MKKKFTASCRCLLPLSRALFAVVAVASLLLFSTANVFAQTTTQTFSTAGTYTWTCPVSVTSVKVECWGGGGGGGVVANSGGGGGGGGAYARTDAVPVTAGTNYTIVVGAGGAADDAAGGGTKTTFATTTVVADFGLGTISITGAAGGLVTGCTGVNAKVAGGTGGAGNTSDYGGGGGGAGGKDGAGVAGVAATASIGGNGGAGDYGSGGTGGTGYAAANGGNGGASALGGGGGGGGGNEYYGGNGGAPGGGGGGGEIVGGEVGAAGQVVLTYTCPNYGNATYTVGSGGDFPNLTQAAASLKWCGISGGPVILELLATYPSVAETFPITFNAIPGASAINTITIRPASGVTARVTSGDPGSGISLITFDGAKYIIFDGQPGGVGGAKEWTIRNTRTAATVGIVITLINDATNNTFKYINVEGEEASQKGLFQLSTTTGTTGNDNNTFSYCYIRDLTSGGTAARPQIGIGSSGTTNKENNNITIDNCRFIDIFNASSSTTASIYIGDNNNTWTITNNHFYQTADVDNCNSNSTFIMINWGGGYNITGNYFGGKAENCGGLAYNITSGTGQFAAIFFSVSGTFTSSVNTINNNTFQNFSYTTTCTLADAVLGGIWIFGSANNIIGQSGAGNIIGSASATGSITVTNDAASGSQGIQAIYQGGSGSVTISYNTIGGITIAGTRDYAHTYGIWNAAGTATISNNTIGGTVANSIVVSTTGTSNDYSAFYGIYNSSASGITCTNNTIQNIDHNPTTGGLCSGIYNDAGPMDNCSGNTIKNITTDANAAHYIIYHDGTTATISTNTTIQDISVTSTGASAALYGIYINTASAVTVSSNTIGSTTANNIRNDGQGVIVGIRHTTGAGALTCENNTIQNLYKNNAAGNLVGIYNTAGTLTISTGNGNTIKNITSASDASNFGIYHVVDATATINSNVIQDFTVSSTGASAALYGIYINTASAVTVSSNTIGSTAANNITNAGQSVLAGIYHVTGTGAITCNSNTIQELYKSNTAAAGTLFGIYNGAGALSATSNTIKNIDNNCTYAGGALYGIYCNAAGTHTITKSTIENLNLTNTGANATLMRAIFVNTGGGSVTRNLVRYLTNAATSNTAEIKGIAIGNGSGAWDVYNNVVIISNSTNTNPIIIHGIETIGTGTEKYYHNTVKISGTPSTSAVETAAFYKNGITTTTSTVKNNVFQNMRTGSPHRAVNALSTALLTINYNYLEVDAGQASNIGRKGATDYTFANWKTAVPASPNDLNGTETINALGYATATFVGANAGTDLLATVPDDRVTDANRDAAPWMGAYEGIDLTPIELLKFSATCYNEYIELSWSTASETNNDYFTVERGSDGMNFQAILTVDGAGNSNQVINYSAIDENPLPGIAYYRLKQTDFDGKYEYSRVIVTCTGNLENSAVYINVYPNPASQGETVYLDINGLYDKELLVVVLNTLGKQLYSKVMVTDTNKFTIEAVDSYTRLAPGVYYIVASSNSNLFHKKLVIR